MAAKTKASTDLRTYTLLQFDPVKSAKPGDILIFRSNSVSHSDELPLYHARPCRVVANKAANARGKIAVWFKDMEEGKSIPLDPRNLIAFTQEALSVATDAYTHIHGEVLKDGPQDNLLWASFSVKTFLARIGMYTSYVPKGAQVQVQQDLPF